MLNFLNSKCRNLIKYQSSNFMAEAIAPSTKTTVLLKKLPTNVTDKLLKESLNELTLRKVELQPGCVLHVTNIAAAEKISNLIKSTYKNLEPLIASAAIPSVLIENLSEDVSVDSVKNAFSNFNPNSVNIIGGSTIQVTSDNYNDALAIAEHIESIAYNNELLKTNVMKLSSGKYVVQVYNFTSSIITKEQENSIKESIQKISPDSNVNVYNAPKSIQIRFNSNISNVKKYSNTIKKISKSGFKLEVSEPFKMKLPSLFIRNTEKIDITTIISILEKTGTSRIQTTKRSKDKYDDLIVAYYDSDEKAFDALSKLKGSSISGIKINVTYNLFTIKQNYREVAEPELIFYDLPIDWDESVISNRLKDLSILRFTIDRDISKDKSTRDIRILFGNMYSANLAKTILSGLCSRVDEDGCSHTGLNVTIPAGSKASLEEVINLIHSSDIPDITSININNNRTAFVNFLTLSEADLAQKSYISGSIKLPTGISNISNKIPNISIGSMISMRKSIHPTYVIELSNLSIDIPVNDIEELIKLNQCNQYYLYSDRYAIVKFRRHQLVVPGIKKLKQIKINDKLLIPKRYYPIISDGKTSLDIKNEDDEKFDQFALKMLMKDNMSSDPASRYNIIKNAFDRALFDTQAMNNTSEAVNYLLGDNITPKIKEEATSLLLSKVIDEPIKQRLFELFMQRSDIYEYTKDFNDLSILFGDIENPTNDPFHWKEFEILSDTDIIRVKKALSERDYDLTYKISFKNHEMDDDLSSKYLSVKKDNDDDDDDEDNEEGDMDNLSNNKNEVDEGYDLDDDDDNDIVIKDDEDDSDSVASDEEIEENKGKRKKGKENEEESDSFELRDDDGRVWSGVILDTDTTQKILPAGRLMSHRALVMIGNGRGAGGCGMGKGPEPGKATEAAFRDALRNLIFIDLYENAGLAHDLFGKHNGCYCYVRATPNERLMVASPFAEEILNRFGIVSASVKFAGKRNPYSMVKSLIKALKNHKNLDEIAKERGKRFLTLRWAHQQNL